MPDTPRTHIYLPSVAAVESDTPQAVAERVDRVLTSLVDQLRSFQAADASELGGVPASSVVSGSNSMYYQTFENEIHKAWHLRSGNNDAITYPNNGQAGGRALRTTNRAVWMSSNVNIPFDPARLYRMRTRVRKISGTSQQVVVGVEGVGADRVTVVDRAGGTGTTTDQNLVCLNATITSTSWATYSGYFKGVAASGTATSPSTDASLPRVLHQDTKYIRPFLALSIGGDNGVYEIDYITLEVLTETPEVNKILTEVDGRAAADISSTVKVGSGVAENKVDGAAVSTGAIGGGGDGGKNHLVAGSVQATNIKALTIEAGLIATDAIIARHIKVGEVTANKITVTSLSAIKATLGTVNAGVLQNLATNPTRGIRLDSTWVSTRPSTWESYIDFGASGSEPIFKFPGLEVLASGDATFSGTVAATSFTATVATFNGRLSVSGYGSEFKDMVRFRSGGSIQVEDARIVEFYDYYNTFRGDLRAMAHDDTPASTMWARGNWYFNSDATVHQKLLVKGEIEIDGALNHDGSTVGFFSATPASQDAGWAAFDSSGTRRTGDATLLSTIQLAEIVDTLIQQLVRLGLLSDIT